MKFYRILPFCLGVVLFQGVALFAASQNQVVQLKNSVTIPEGNLEPGAYTFAVEDRLSDRGIVRVSNSDGSKHYLVLAVPASQPIAVEANGLSYFTSSKDGSQTIRAWKCPDCRSALEFVYPKLEAVKITAETGKAVLAVDPDYDKLPPNLSPDDMKVVTLWLLSPKRVENNTGEGVNAEKLASVERPASGDQKAASPSGQAGGSASAGLVAANHRPRLPKTASNSFSFVLYGMILLIGALLLRFWRIRPS